MDFNLKTYKCLKIKHYFKTINFFFFFHGTSLNTENWIKIEQILINYEFKYFRIFNTLMINILKRSILKNLIILIQGPIVLLHCKNDRLTFKKLKSIDQLISLLCLKLNNKIYSKKQIRNIKKFSYTENVFILYRLANKVIKKPYHKFTNKEC